MRLKIESILYRVTVVLMKHRIICGESRGEKRLVFYAVREFQ